MLTTPTTEQARQQEWNIISITARDNGFQLQIIHNLKKKLLLRTLKQKAHSRKHSERNGSHLRITAHLYTKEPTYSKVST
jgi:hypothetical protein